MQAVSQSDEIKREYGLTHKQTVFVLEYARTHNAAAAARVAYPDAGRHCVQGQMALRSQRVRAALRHVVLGLASGCAGEMVDLLADIARDGTAPAGARIQAARTVLEVSSFIGPGRVGDDAPALLDKPMSAMTVEELAAAAAYQERQLSAALQVVTDLRAEAAAQAGAVVIDAQAAPVLDAPDPWS